MQADLTKLDDILTNAASVSDGQLIPILQSIQERYGYLPKNVVLEMSKRTGIPASRVYGVATFYEQFHLEPRGRHIIRCCRGTACHVKGGPDIIETIQNHLEIKPGETTEDLSFTFETVACLGACALAPLIVIDNNYHGMMTPQKVEDVLNSYQRKLDDK